MNLFHGIEVGNGPLQTLHCVLNCFQGIIRKHISCQRESIDFAFDFVCPVKQMIYVLLITHF